MARAPAPIQPAPSRPVRSDAARNRTAIVLNHELSNTELAERVPTTFDGGDVPTYDTGTAGGTTRTPARSNAS